MSADVIPFPKTPARRRHVVADDLPEGVHDLRKRFGAHKEPVPVLARSPLMALVTAMLAAMPEDQFRATKSMAYSMGESTGEPCTLSAWNYLAEIAQARRL